MPVLLVVLLLLAVPLALVVQDRLLGLPLQNLQLHLLEDQANHPTGLLKMLEEALRLWAQIQTSDDPQESSKGPGGQARQMITIARAAGQVRAMRAVDSLLSPSNKARLHCLIFGKSDPLSKAFTRGLVATVCACALVLVLALALVLVLVHIHRPFQAHIQLKIRFHLHLLSLHGP